MDSESALYRSHPNWRVALAVVDGILPGSAGPDPDELAGVDPTSWHKVAIQGRSDLDIWCEVRPSFEQHLQGLLVVVTFASYLRMAGPFFVQAGRIDGFVREHAALLEDAMFSGDVTLMSPSAGALIAVHHDEAFAVIEGRKVHGFSDSGVGS